MADKHDDKHHHHVLTNKLGLRVLLTLLSLTLITVIASRINFGAFNFPIAILIASAKALLVVLFFMGIKYDDNENKVIFFSSVFFVLVFFSLTASDVFTRNINWRATGPILKEVSAASTLKKPWVGTDELREKGKEIFAVQCTPCHGVTGEGNGPAAAALNPKPRNFHQDAGWKNGRKPTDVFMTLKNGLNNIMPSFATLPTDDRWSLAHYVLSLGPKPPEPTAEDYKKVGILDPNRDDGGVVAEVVQRKIPIDFAIDRYLQGAKN